MAIEWKWGAELKNKGNEGFNDAGILTFNSHAINSFVRELFQNSNDAKAEGEKKIVIGINFCKISKSIIPAFSEYLEILKRVQEAHPAHSKFFSKAHASLVHDEIPFLVYSDSKTRGLVGSENDDYSSFDACVLSEGISAKVDKNAGGSFGIGKNAIYGISNLRTVFYSSLNQAGEYIFQAVAKLASYRFNKSNHEGRVYLGNGNDRLSVRSRNDIPQTFIRQDPGLSQFIMGVDLSNDWQVEFSRAIIRNYWMLLIEDGLEVELLENNKITHRINQQNVVSLMQELFEKEEDELTLKPYGNPYLFYEAYNSGIKVEFEIPIIGKCSFFYIEGERGENNVAYLRNGMVVFSDIEKRLVGANVTGVFRCESQEGNAILRQMEPPKHDSFEPQMLDEKHESLSIKEGDKIIKSIKSSIRAIIKALIEKYKHETETPAFLNQLFEDLQKKATESNKGIRKNEKSPNETFYRRAIEDIIEVGLFSEQENTYVSSNSGTVTSTGTGLGNGEGPTRTRKPKSKGGKGKSAGASKGGKTPKHIVNSRIFYSSDNYGKHIYKAILSVSEDLLNVETNLFQSGDAGEEVAFILHNVSDSIGNPINFNQINDSDGNTSEYKIYLNMKKGNNIYFLEVSENQKSAFIIKG